jgi:hypothetical protein
MFAPKTEAAAIVFEMISNYEFISEVNPIKSSVNKTIIRARYILLILRE